MALAPCPDCRHECSLAAAQCPSCGRPFKSGDLVPPRLRKVQVLAVLSVLVILGAIVMVVMGLIQFDPQKLSAETAGFSSPVMALEFVETTAQAGVILDQNGAQNRRALRSQIYVDFAWIVCYWLLFMAVSYLLSRRNCPWASYLAAVAAVAASSAAAFDVCENLGMLQVIDQPAMTQQDLTNLHIRDAALVKWTLVFVTMAVLAPTFYGLNEKLNRIGYLFTLTALVGGIGLWYKPLLMIVALPLLIGLILLAYYSWRWPQLFLEESW